MGFIISGPESIQTSLYGNSSKAPNNTHNKCSPEWISCQENQGESLGEVEVIERKYSSDAGSDQGKQDLGSL